MSDVDQDTLKYWRKHYGMDPQDIQDAHPSMRPPPYGLRLASGLVLGFAVGICAMVLVAFVLAWLDGGL